MDTIKVEKKNTLLVAHRGLSGIERENTVAAFIAAGNRSYYGIETDIYRTADGKFAVSHDKTLQRVAGVDIRIEDTTLADLQKIALLDRDGNRRNALRVPSLEEYIEVCKRYGKHAVPELKSNFTEEELARIVAIFDEAEYLEHTTFIAFGYENLKRLRAIRPEQSMQYLFSEFTDEIVARVLNERFDVDVHHAALTEERVQMLHGAGLRINCWTVDKKEKAELLAAWGVDYITTNILE